MSTKSALVSAAVLGLGALALTACQSDASGTSTGAAPSVTASSSAAAGTGSTDGVAVSAPPASTASAASTGSTGSAGSAAPTATRTTGSGTRTGAADADAASDSYAFTHPCSPRQLTVHVVRRAAAPSQRVVQVRNNGPWSCGLSYYPLVSLDHAAGGGRLVKPLIPSGLGGAPATPVYAGRTVYAVIDLDPSGATAGTVAGIDELNVLPDGDHMPNAATLNFPLGSGVHVLKPKLGLYLGSVADAVASMESADYQS